MPTNLTGSSVSSTYDQLLHVNDGPAATEKTVYSGTGVATALKVGTGSASVDNIKIDGNTISSTNANGNIVLSPDGSGTVLFSKANITGGVITGVSLTGLSGDLPVADGGTGASSLTGYVKGNGTSAFTASATVPFGDLSGFKFGEFFSTQDQTPATNTPTALTFNNSAAFNSGITVVSNSRITFDTTGVYEMTVSVQFDNKGAADHDGYIWFRKNGTDIADSNSIVTVPKAGDGGRTLLQVTLMESITASQYIEVVVMVEDANVDIEHIPAAVGPPAYPAVPSVILVAKRIA
jgi:hypothetical protein